MIDRFFKNLVEAMGALFVCLAKTLGLRATQVFILILCFFGMQLIPLHQEWVTIVGLVAYLVFVYLMGCSIYFLQRLRYQGKL